MTEFSSNLTFDKQETVVLASRVPGGSASTSAELEHALRATSIVLTVNARASAGGSLVLTAEESDDGESWSEIEAIGTLTRTGSASLTVTPTLDWLRVAWEGGAGWTLDITATGHATIEAGNIGSGGGAPTLAEVLAEGGDPDGNPVTGNVVITPAVGEEGLTITSPSDDSTKLLNLTGVHTSFQLDNDGTLLYSSDDTPSMEIRGIGKGASLSVVGQQATSLECFLGHSLGLTLTDHNSGQNYIKLRRTFQIFSYHAAPADGDLVAGECALWFDQTDGAAKLMVKAKTADGTVRTGSLNLS